MRLKEVIAAGSLLVITSMASAKDCYDSSILTPNPFMGNAGEIFKLADGTIWEVKDEYENLSAYYPTNVIICPSRGKLVVYGKKLNVKKVGGR
jgi:hypothetical protein